MKLSLAWLKKSRRAHRAAAKRAHAHEQRAHRTWLSERKLVRRRSRQIKHHTPLRDKALAEARRLIGVMEQGGNNRGPEVEKIIRENGGVGEPWCGDFVAHCYRAAGSKAVTRSWAAVRLLRGLLGIHATSSPKPGDLVTYTFDHVGIFEKDLGNGEIQTIEGNTGATGAVSDSTTGGDGVYRKHRPKSLVHEYLRVER